ncbi:alpha/beta hydrolase [Sphingomonas sp. IC-56]|uniref:alpha/beta fold hydrolase n=1 Tax=Sphingomonas sp. IC-56 TaxID=2898529 RepID=UPI001E2D6990|nr:alpha/beta hydrolase [Sphingomonas sp. IC-56]MCD2323498.1 alpha/beta hydrolase [Sphingomonas sp. IC-56]
MNTRKMAAPLGAGAAAAGALVAWSAYAARKAEALAPADGQFIELAGAQLHYVDLGPRDAPVLVMVHGLMGQLRNFSHSLAERLTADYRVILVDRPGWGHSAVRGARPGITEQAAITAALIEALGLGRPLVVGHSLGGAVALALGLDRPELVRGLALIAPLSQPVNRAPKPFLGLLVPAPLRFAAAWLLAVPAGAVSRAATARAVFAPDPVPDDFATRGGGALALRPKSYMAGSFEILNVRGEMRKLRERYSEMRVPVAILFGREDRVLDPQLNGEQTAGEIPGATLTRVEGGHMLPVTHPDVTATWLRELMR